MPNLFEIHHSVGTDEQKFYLIAVDEPDCRQWMQDEETAGNYEAGWTIYDMGVVVGTSASFPAGVTQLTKAADGRWDETA